MSPLSEYDCDDDHARPIWSDVAASEERLEQLAINCGDRLQDCWPGINISVSTLRQDYEIKRTIRAHGTGAARVYYAVACYIDITNCIKL